jgi:KRAB domain-containing zinc finger protein
MMGLPPQQALWMPQGLSWPGSFHQFHPSMIAQPHPAHPGQMPGHMHGQMGPPPPHYLTSPSKVQSPLVPSHSPHSSPSSPGPKHEASSGEEDRGKKHICRYCGKRFKLRHVLQQHELTHTNHKPYYCDICGFRARQKAVIWKHKKLKHGKLENVPIRVSKDDGLAKYPHIDEMNAAAAAAAAAGELPDTPLQIAEDEDDLGTPSPERKTPSPSRRGLPPPPMYGSPIMMDSNNADRQFVCNLCNKSFRNKHVLAQHELTHSTFRPYACTYCDFRAKQKAVIWRHNKVKHADREVSYTTESVPRSPGGSIIEPVNVEDPQRPQEEDEEDDAQMEEATKSVSVSRSVSESVAASVNNVLSRLKSSLTSKRKKSYSLFTASRQAVPSMVPFQQNSQSPVTLTGFASSVLRFQCKTCQKVFKNKHILLQHELVHSPVRPYKCQWCSFRAKQKAVMWRHNRSRHPEKGRQRIVEDIDLTQIRESSAADFEKESMELQAMNNHNAAAAQSLLNQAQTHPPSQPNEDQENHGPNAANGGLQNGGQHMPEEDNEEDDDDFEEELDDIESDDENEGDEFFCQTCGKGFSDEAAMEQHKRKHMEPLKCEVCEYKTRIPANMEKHKERKHTKKASPMQTTQANTNYVPNPVLLAHQVPAAKDERQVLMAPDLRPKVTIDGKKLFYCNYCSFCTAHQTSLSRHKRLKHDGETENSQGDSGDESHMSNLSNLQYSKPSSPAPMPAQIINFCMQQNPSNFPTMFANPPILPMPMHLQSHQLPRPMQSHEDNDPQKKFQCHVCLKSFKHRHVLKQHSLIHTNEKPYKCEYCDFRGRQKASLWRHRRKHLEEMERQNGAQGMMIPGQIQANNLTLPMLAPLGSHPNQENGQRGPVFPGHHQEEEDDDDDEEGEEEGSEDPDPDDGVLMAQDYANEDNTEDMEAYAEDATETETGEGQNATVVPTADGKYACSLCGHTLASKMSLQRHCNTHKTGKCYKCQECGYETPYAYTLQRHINTTHTGGEHACDQCTQSFKSMASLLKHKQSHHGANSEGRDDADIVALQCDETME